MSVFDMVASASLLLGAFFCVVGGIGILRLPDFYCRTHGASITDTLGAGLLLLGLGVHELGLMASEGASPLNVMKLVILVLFLFLASPTSGHALVKAAYAHGVKVETGPGENRDSSS